VLIIHLSLAAYHAGGGNLDNYPNYHGMITLSVYWTCWRLVMHVQTWASYSAVYRLCSLSIIIYSTIPWNKL